MAELPELIVTDARAFEQWLQEHQHDESGVKLLLAKKGTTAPTSLTYAEALQIALCFGWIDGQTNKRDDFTYFQRFTPRRAKSIWSKRNVGYTEALINSGRMRARGQAEIDRAKADGRWDAAYEGPAKMAVPDDLAAAIAATPAAAEAWTKLSSQNRYAFLFRLHGAKREETRVRHIEKFVAMLTSGEVFHSQKSD